MKIQLVPIVVFFLAICSCNVSKNMQTRNIYSGMIFYNEGSSFVIFYPVEKNNLSAKKIIKLIDNNYGNLIWFSSAKYRYAIEDVLPRFDSLKYEHNGFGGIYKYTYVKIFFNKDIRTKLVDSIYRLKDFKYLDYSYDEFRIDDRNLRIDSLIFINQQINAEYLLSIEKNKFSNGILDHPYPR